MFATVTSPARAASLSLAGTPSSRLASSTSTLGARSGSFARIFSFDAGKKWIIRLGRIGISRSGAGAPTASGLKKSLGERITLERYSWPFPGVEKDCVSDQQVGVNRATDGIPGEVWLRPGVELPPTT